MNLLKVEDRLNEQSLGIYSVPGMSRIDGALYTVTHVNGKEVPALWSNCYLWDGSELFFVMNQLYTWRRRAI